MGDIQALNVSLKNAVLSSYGLGKSGGGSGVVSSAGHSSIWYHGKSRSINNIVVDMMRKTNDQSCNNIMDMGEFLFYKMEDLQRIYVKSCNNIHITNNMFYTNKKLESLKIGGYYQPFGKEHLEPDESHGSWRYRPTRVKYIEDEAFKNNKELKTIILSNNEIESVKYEIFQYNLKLEKLDLSCNKIKAIDYSNHHPTFVSFFFNFYANSISCEIEGLDETINEEDSMKCVTESETVTTIAEETRTVADSKVSPTYKQRSFKSPTSAIPMDNSFYNYIYKNYIYRKYFSGRKR